MIELKDFPDRKTLLSFQKKCPRLDMDAMEGWLAILGIASYLEEELDRFLAERTMQQSRFFSLILLVRNPVGLTAGALAAKLGVSNPTVTGLVSRMERDGLVERESSPVSKRESIIRISEEGRKRLFEILPHHYTKISKIMEGITGEEVELLKKIFKKIGV